MRYVYQESPRAYLYMVGASYWGGIVSNRMSVCLSCRMEMVEARDRQQLRGTCESLTVLLEARRRRRHGHEAEKILPRPPGGAKSMPAIAMSAHSHILSFVLLLHRPMTATGEAASSSVPHTCPSRPVILYTNMSSYVCFFPRRLLHARHATVAFAPAERLLLPSFDPGRAARCC